MDERILLTILILSLWIWKCVVRLKEGQHKNIVRFWRWHRTLSGTRHRIADKNGNLIDLPKNKINDKSFGLIFFPIERVDKYWFGWVQALDKKRVKSMADVLWGDKDRDSQLVVERYEFTDHHRDQADYRFLITDMETGEKKEAKENEDAVENIKIDSHLNGTVRMQNPRRAQYKAGGRADWYNSLLAVVTGVYGEVVREKVYADLKDLQGEKLSRIRVKDIRPGKKEGDTLSFLERVNYEINQLILDEEGDNSDGIKGLGVELCSLSLLDYEMAGADSRYADALRDRAIAKVNLDAAKSKSQAKKLMLDVQKNFVNDIVNNNAEATIKIKKTEDVTAVKEAQAQKDVRTLIKTGVSSSTAISSPIDVNDIIKQSAGLTVANEITADTEIAEPKPKGGKK